MWHVLSCILKFTARECNFSLVRLSNHLLMVQNRLIANKLNWLTWVWKHRRMLCFKTWAFWSLSVSTFPPPYHSIQHQYSYSQEPSWFLASQRPSGLSPMRMMSMDSLCFRLSSFLPPLQSTRALPLWMICSGPVSCCAQSSSRQKHNKCNQTRQK